MSTWTFLWSLIRYRPGLYIANLIGWTLIHLAPILPGLLTKAFFDRLEGTAAVNWSVWSIIAMLIGAAIARIALIAYGFVTDVHTRFRMGMLLRRNLLSHVLREPGARAIPVSPGEAISYFRDDVDQAEEAASWSVDVFGMLGFAVVSCYILLRIDAQMTLLVFVPLILVVTAAQLATARLQKYRAASREATAKVTGAISEMFANVQAIQVAGAEARVIERFSRLNERRRRTMVKDKVMTEALDSVFANAVNLGTGLILLLAAYKMREGSFTVGDLSLFVYYLTFVTQLISNVGKFIAYYKQLTVSAGRLASLLQGAPAAKLIEPNPLPLRENAPVRGEEAAEGAATVVEPLERLEVVGLTYVYPETGRGIRDVHVSLTRGSFTVITGMIGSGKTTLVRTLLGLLPRQSGSILWNGRPIERPGDFFVPPRSAYTAQIPRLYSDKLRDNILLGYPASEERLMQAVRTAVLEEDIARLQEGLDTIIGPRGVKLSGGQAQRTAAARMLVRDAELYVFDDLSSALDVETERKLWEGLFRVRADATCLVVSHRKAALSRADRIIVMRDGSVEAQGTAEQLLAESESFRKLWHGES
ncbi:ABC transporter ATP-binding protein [Paenibacillus thermoaerophilus]|uniref:ABC transporter ATP-binding protein n=1 Tax=Paenibacillus thermoaerophilus TaxID=1215385 RepID=A0ABW2UYP6_9BACL|nr:ABC transporter ATP-binding protein [Paenibacillus thermoaerophilus]TMV10438.1 ABC transporter ATP-binding protein [Paenibacillus thermoaerophilus]